MTKKNNFIFLERNEQGITMIEVMVTFVIISIAFIGIIQSFPYGLSITKEAEQATTASFLAQQKLEELNSFGYEFVDTGIIEAKHRLSSDTSSYLYNYQRNTVVSYIDSNLNDSLIDTGIKKISVSVYYNNVLSKKEKIYNISTLLSQL